jgi:hypothetical protein
LVGITPPHCGSCYEPEPGCLAPHLLVFVVFHLSLVGSVLLIFLVFCVVILCVFTFRVPCCDVRYDFHIQTMFRSSLTAVCRRVRVLLHTQFRTVVRYISQFFLSKIINYVTFFKEHTTHSRQLF